LGKELKTSIFGGVLMQRQKLFLVFTLALLLLPGFGLSGPAHYYPPKREVRVEPLLAKSDITITLPNGINFCLDQAETEQSLDGQWRISPLEGSSTPFSLDVDEKTPFMRPDFDDKGWDLIPVPLNWTVKYEKVKDAEKPFVKGWYRKTVMIPKEQRGKRVLLSFDVIGYDAKLYLNGNYVGSHHGDFTPWEIDVTDYVVFGENNLIAIRVLTDYGTGFTGYPARHAYGPAWGMGDVKAGLWQSCRIKYQSQVYFKRMLINPVIAESAVEVDYFIENQSAQVLALPLYAVVSSAREANVFPANTRVGELALVPGTNQGRFKIKLQEPKFWHPDQPYLYYLTLALADERQLVAARTERFGYREFKTKGKNFYLNGERIFLFGENVPSNWYGGFQRDEAERLERDLLNCKRSGYNIVRNPHMPLLPMAYKIADEIGIMIYNEWGWCFTTELDQNKFEQHNLPELEEWVYRDYNHPSVVMWSLGNEVRYDNPFVKEQLDKQVALVRKRDGQKRPICSFSGMAFEFGSTKLESDFLDLHTYTGLGFPWTTFDSSIEAIFNFASNVYGQARELNKPFVIWECVGFSWGYYEDPEFSPGDIDQYAKYTKMPSTIGEPNGIGFAGVIGLDAALDPSRGLVYGQRLLGKRIAELIRYNENVQGFAPWFQNFALDAATLWTQPLFFGLRTENGTPPMNFFSNKSYRPTLWLTNDQNKELAGLKLQLELVDEKGNLISLGSHNLGQLGAFQRKELPLEIIIPQSVKPGVWQLRLTITAGAQVQSQNFYEIYVQGQELLSLPLRTDKQVAVFAPDTNLGQKFLGIMQDLEIRYRQISDLTKLDQYEVLIIPPSTVPFSFVADEAQSRLLLAWVDKGGQVIQFEQNYQGETVFCQLESAGSPYVDLVIPKHPVFAGLPQLALDKWENQDQGRVIYYAAKPFTENALAVRAPFLGGKTTYNAVAEGVSGKGRILITQLAATQLWGVDSAASKFIRNTLEYMLANKLPYNNARPWVQNKPIGFAVEKENVEPIDLRKFVTRGYRDEVPGDKLGGWTDQGDNDFRYMPTGSNVFCGVPFEIIDPETNNGKGCIVLRGEHRHYFPESVEEIEVNAKYKRLFFLHTAAWVFEPGKIGEYVVHYEDGTVEIIDIYAKRNIDDWWAPGELAEAKLAFVRENPLQGSVGVWAYEWENPKANVKIESIAVSSNSVAIPILIAISGEK
jgi:beta-galactosidase